MAYAISMQRSEIEATPNERFKALKARYTSKRQLGDGDPIKIMDRDLYEATKNGDVEKFIDALEEVSESSKLALPLIFDQVTPSGNSLLHVAASSGKEDVMELILSQFQELVDIVPQKNFSEDTPLHVAVRDGRLKATRMLISQRRGLDIMYWKNKDSKSPLYLAAENCHSIKWQPREERGSESPVIVIQSHNQEKDAILELLLEESARDGAYAVKIQGMSPVFDACKGWDADILEKIIDRLPKLIHVRDENGGTPLHVAASVGNYSAVKLLLEKCPHLALQTDKNGSYPIHIACEGWSYITLSELRENTWSDLAEIKNKKGQNILHVAAKAGKDFAVECICEYYSQLDTIEKLVNAKDIDGNTPLHLASMHNHCDVMRSLTKDKRIDLRLRNNDGLTALDVAMESRRLSTRNPALLGRAILIVAGVPRSEGRDVLSPREQASGASKSSPAKWIKDQVNTLLLVATLVASVTFSAGLTLPGGYNASGDPHPGTATMLYHRMFRVFIIANMFAMYSSILAVVVLLWGLNRDFYVAELAYHSAGPLLLMALTGMSVAFFAAISVAVSRLTWLGSLVMSVGVLYLAMVVVVLAALIFPSSKTTMFIVVFYYIVVFTVRKCVKFCAKVFYGSMSVVLASLFTFRFQTVVRVYKRVFRLRESS